MQKSSQFIGRMIVVLGMMLSPVFLHATHVVAVKPPVSAEGTGGLGLADSAVSPALAPVGDLDKSLALGESPTKDVSILKKLMEQIDNDSINPPMAQKEIVQRAAEYLLALSPSQRHTQFRYFGLLRSRFYNDLTDAQQEGVRQEVNELGSILTPNKQKELIKIMKQFEAALNSPIDISMLDFGNDVVDASPGRGWFRRPAFLGRVSETRYALEPNELAIQSLALNRSAQEMLDNKTRPDIAVARARDIAAVLEETPEVASSELEHTLRLGIDTYIKQLNESIRRRAESKDERRELDNPHIIEIGGISQDGTYAPRLIARHMFDLYVTLIRRRTDLIPDQLSHTLLSAMNLDWAGSDYKEASAVRWVFQRITAIAQIAHKYKADILIKTEHTFQETLADFDHMAELMRPDRYLGSIFGSLTIAGALFVLYPLFFGIHGLIAVVPLAQLSLGLFAWAMHRKITRPFIYLRDIAEELAEFKAKKLPPSEVMGALTSFDEGTLEFHPKYGYGGIFSRLMKRWGAFRALVKNAK